MVLAGRQARVVHETPVSLTVDGGLGFGQAIGEQAMRLAIAKAAHDGMAALGVRNTGHLGRIGHWAEGCAEAGLLSLHVVNTSGFGVLVAPCGSREARLSANPIAAGTPVPGDAPIILDISTASDRRGQDQGGAERRQGAARGLRRRRRGPADARPAVFYGPPRGAILPFGGHKGSGLSVIVEVLAGALTGGGCTRRAAPGRVLRNNMCSSCWPTCLARATPAGRSSAFIAWIKAAAPTAAGRRILLPGELERRTRAERLAHGLPLDARTLEEIVGVAKGVGVSLDQAALRQEGR